MRKLLIALAAGLAASVVQADAGARGAVTSRGPTVLTTADGASRVIDGSSAVLHIGDTLSYDFAYELQAWDGGLPVARVEGGPFWSPFGIDLRSTGGIAGQAPFHGAELAAVSLYFFPPVGKPWLLFDGTSATLFTSSDDQAQSLQRSGAGRVSVTLIDGGFHMDEEAVTLPDAQIDAAAFPGEARALPQQVSAVPEPTTMALLAAGLGGLALRRRHAMVSRRS